MADIFMSTRSAGTKKMFEDSRGSATMIAAQRETAAACAGSGKAAVHGAADWISLAAAPTFAIMALITGIVGGGQSDLLCSAAQDALALSGMVPMYLLMSAFHLAPWLKLISTRRSLSTGPDPAFAKSNSAKASSAREHSQGMPPPNREGWRAYATGRRR